MKRLLSLTAVALAVGLSTAHAQMQTGGFAAAGVGSAAADGVYARLDGANQPFTGQVAIKIASATNFLRLGVNSDFNTYNLISLNGTMTENGNIGLGGGGSTDGSLYVQSNGGNGIVFRNAGTRYGVMSAAGNWSLGGDVGSESMRVVRVASSNTWITANGSNGASASLDTSARSMLLGPTTATGIQLGGSTVLTLTNGAWGAPRITASGSAPGATGAKFEVVCGTAGGTAKLQMYAGTSSTPTTVLDNVGSGVSGC